MKTTKQARNLSIKEPCMVVTITNTTDDERHTLKCTDLTEARHWAINHLDMSKIWFIN